MQNVAIATRGEVDDYMQEQWQRLRIPGDWRQTAIEFFEWAEKQNWKLNRPWQTVADGFIRRQRARVLERMAGGEKHADAGMTLLVCDLCWHVHDARNDERADDDCLAECRCVDRTVNSTDMFRLLSRCQRLRKLSFESARPAAAVVCERIARLREQTLREYGDEYERRTAEWFAACGAGG